MTIWEFLSALWRRWYIAIPLAILVILGVRWFVNDIDGEYRYDAIVRLEYDQGDVAEYLEVPVNLRSLVQAVQLSVSDDQTANRLERAGHTAWYRVRVLDFGRRPILEVTTEHPNQVITQATLTAIHSEIDDALRDLQMKVGAPETDLVVATELESVVRGEPELAMSSRSQLALVGAAVFIFALLVGTIDRGLTAIGHQASRARSGRAFRKQRRMAKKTQGAARPGFSFMSRSNS